MKTFFVLVVLGLGVAVSADTKGPQKLSVADISQKVDEAQSSIRDVQMDINMEMKDTLSGTQQKMKGLMKIKSPNLVFVHYTQPEEQSLYVKDHLMQMYQPSQKTVYQQHGGQGKDAAPVYLGVGRELKRYMAISRVKIIRESDSEVGLLFTPNDKMTAGFDSMKVYIHKKDWWPYQMEVETPSVVTKAQFTNFKFNQGLDSALFEFTPPKGSQVVEGAVF